MIALASADNIGWSVIPGGPCLEPGLEGSADGGCVFAGTGLVVELPGDRIGIPYGTFPAPHKHPPPGHGEGVAWATWPAAAWPAWSATRTPRFWTPPLQLHGQTLHLNANTQEGGAIRVEIQDETFTPVPGYTLAESTPITGNHLEAPVTWGPTTKIPTTRHPPPHPPLPTPPINPVRLRGSPLATHLEYARASP